jgi:hypothetical protein
VCNTLYKTGWTASAIDLKALKKKDRCVLCSESRVDLTVKFKYIYVRIVFYNMACCGKVDSVLYPCTRPLGLSRLRNYQSEI